MSDKEELRTRLLSRRRTRNVEVPETEETTTGTTTEEAVVVGTKVTTPRDRGRDRTSEAVASAVEGTNFIATLARHLGAGNRLLVYVDPKNDNIVRVELFEGTGMPTPKRGSLGSDYYLHVHNPEFWAWESKWKALSPEEKVEYATKLGVTWDEHENPKINNMRVTEAVRVFEKVDKYKPEYATVSQRKHAKAKYLAGELDVSADHE